MLPSIALSTPLIPGRDASVSLAMLHDLPETLYTIKNWGTWSYTDKPLQKRFRGECVLFHSWC